MAQPLQGMTADSPPNQKMPPVPGAWTRSYRGKSGKEGRVFTSTYGASNDILDEGYRRLLINGCFWAAGLEDEIIPDAQIAFVGPYNPTWGRGGTYFAPHVGPPHYFQAGYGGWWGAVFLFVSHAGHSLYSLAQHDGP